MLTSQAPVIVWPKKDKELISMWKKQSEKKALLLSTSDHSLIWTTMENKLEWWWMLLSCSGGKILFWFSRKWNHTEEQLRGASLHWLPSRHWQSADSVRAVTQAGASGLRGTAPPPLPTPFDLLRNHLSLSLFDSSGLSQQSQANCTIPAEHGRETFNHETVSNHINKQKKGSSLGVGERCLHTWAAVGLIHGSWEHVQPIPSYCGAAVPAFKLQQQQKAWAADVHQYGLHQSTAAVHV